MKESSNNNYWKYFRVGDIVKDEDESVWGNKLFEISKMHGNEYLPLVIAYFVGKEKNTENMCNFDVRNIRLITNPKRPFRKLPKTQLFKLMQRGVLEAKREFIMRVNSKNL